MVTRPAIFRWRQTEPGIILCAVRWYLRYPLSLRDVEELLEERGLNVDYTTVRPGVQDHGPESGESDALGCSINGVLANVFLIAFDQRINSSLS